MPQAVVPQISSAGSAAQARGPTIDAGAFVDGVVLEVLPGFGLAHVKGDDGRLLGISRAVVAQQAFETIRESQRVRLQVLNRFARVVAFEAL